MLLTVAHLIESTGRPSCRPIFFLLFCLAFSPVASQAEDPLVRDVTVSKPEVVGEVPPAYSSSNIPIDAPSPTGRGLLRFYGCVTCHDLATPPYRGRWGPDLDTVGSKSPRPVLHRILTDPLSVRPDAKMPRVPTTEAQRTQIVNLLATLTGELPTPAPSADLDGAALYERGDCRQCHRLGGKGGNRGPSLEGVAERVRTDWLTAYLLDPSEMVPNSRMPLFEWEPAEAAALASYLTRKRAPEIESERESDPTAGLSSAAQLGCFQCHRIGRYTRTLDLPTAAGRRDFLTYHAGDSSTFRLELTEGQIAAMADALSQPMPATVSDSLFLATFWRPPISLQGSAPAAHDSLSSSIDPASCGACHQKQYAEWSGSLHAAAMGPGVIGQLLDSAYDKPSFVGGCQTCHAPNAEQYASLPSGDDRHEINYRFDSGLRAQGITCVACHVRGHTRYGPPISDQAPVQVWRGPGHGGGYESTAYQRSDFCSACHQFGENDNRINGTLLQDTFNEWKSSPHAREGKTCQTCHMPDRSHTWLGIHDSATVASAIDVTIANARGEQTAISAEIRIRNTGAGHHLPTYVTPKLLVTATLQNQDGNPIGNSIAYRAIGREVVLNSEESREVYDTRIPAGGTWMWDYTHQGESAIDASSIAVKVEVYPDHFYASFFRDYDRDGLSAAASAAIADAAERTRRSNYVVFERAYPLSSER